MDPSTEVEVKLLVDGRGMQQLTALPVIGGAVKQARPKRIETAYYDTPDHILERKGFMLRLRKGDGAPLLSVKQETGTAIVRKEWERRIKGDQPQAKDWRGTPLQSLLTEKGAQLSLRRLFTTVIDRAVFNCEYDGALIEVALDRGEIKHDGRELPVSEIELELKHGNPGAVFALARELANHAPLRLSFLSKGERGRLLESGKWASPGLPTRPQLNRLTNLRDGIRIICRTCLKDLMVNEAALANGYDEEAVHQARISIRRLRSALALFKPMMADGELPRLKGEIAGLWDITGPARDLDVATGDLESEMRDARMPAGAATLVDMVKARRDRARRELLSVFQSDRTRLMYIDLARWIENGEWSQREEPELKQPIMRIVGDLLAKRLRKIKKRSRDVVNAKPRKQHRVRIAAKTLRIMCEFFNAALEDERARKPFERLTDVLGAMQKILGRLHDRAARDELLCEIAREASVAPHARPHIGLDAAVKAVASGRGAKSKLLKKLKKASAKLADVKGFW
jgi:triphosphatase